MDCYNCVMKLFFLPFSYQAQQSMKQMMEMSLYSWECIRYQWPATVSTSWMSFALYWCLHVLLSRLPVFVFSYHVWNSWSIAWNQNHFGKAIVMSMISWRQLVESEGYILNHISKVLLHIKREKYFINDNLLYISMHICTFMFTKVLFCFRL